MSDQVLGLDLNHYRPDVPLKTAKEQGVRFILSKCTEGIAWVDQTYAPYQAESKARSLPFGGYVYWRFVIDAAKQAKHYCDSLGKVQFPPIVDVERINNTKPGTKTVPIVSIQANRNHLKVVLDEIERITGMKPMIYTNYASWYYLFGNWDLINEYPVWVANWRTYGEPYLPKPATEWDVHQFTSIYKVEGYTRGLDANWFNGNEAEFEHYIQAYDELWNPPPPVEEKESFVTVEVKKGGDSTIYLLDTPGDAVVVKVEEI